MNPTPQLSRSGVRWRQQNGVPLDKPKMGRGGNFKITEDQAREIWADIQMLATNCRYREFDVCRVIAEHHGVTKSIVNNIRGGTSWNAVTGLDKFIRYE